MERALRRRYAASYAKFNLPAIYTAIETIYPDFDRDFVEAQAAQYREAELLSLLFEDVRCVVGRINISPLAFQLFGQKYKFITTLRDPVDFFVSSYFQMARNRDRRWKLTCSFSDFLDSELANLIGRFFVLYFSGSGSTHYALTDESVGKAKHHIAQFDAVGFLDDLTHFRRQLSEILGVQLWIGHANRCPASQAHRDSMSSEVRSKIERKSAPNFEIYEFARRTFGT